MKTKLVLHDFVKLTVSGEENNQTSNNCAILLIDPI